MLENTRSNAMGDQAGACDRPKHVSTHARTLESPELESNAIDAHTSDSHTLASPSLGSVVAIWIIFAPTAACAAYALFTWASINRTRLNAIYAILLALFFAALFGSLLFGMTRRYLRGRRSSHAK